MIKNKDLRFERQARRRSTTNRVIIHHSASHDVGAETIHRWHLDRGWLGIGYHFVIRKDGSIEEGRPEDTVGAHAGSGANGDSIGVCLTGNFEEHDPSPAQMDSLARLIKEHIFKRYGEIVIEGHSDHMSTACPGRYFPWDELKFKLEADIVSGKYFTDVPDDRWSADHINLLKEKGLIGGYEDGTFKPTEPITREEAAALMGRLLEHLTK